MLAVVIIIISTLIDLFFLWGALERIKLGTGVYQITGNLIGSYWPIVVWATFALFNIIYLIYLLKLGKSKKKNYLILSLILSVTPFLVSSLLGRYFTKRAVDMIRQGF